MKSQKISKFWHALVYTASNLFKNARNQLFDLAINKLCFNLSGLEATCVKFNAAHWENMLKKKQDRVQNHSNLIKI